MISGVHLILFSAQAEALREFLRDKLGFPDVDAGGGWPVFALPPAELAVHPAQEAKVELYLVCDDLDVTAAELARRGVPLARPITVQRWGRLTAVDLPDGSQLGLYQPFHARPGPASPTPIL